MKRVLIVLLSICLLTACNDGNMVKKDKTEDRDRDRDDDEDTDDDDDVRKKKVKEDIDEDEDDERRKDDDDDERTGGGGWTKATREKYIGECVTVAKEKVSRSQAESYCECMQGKIEKKYEMSFDEANRITQADLSTPEAIADIEDCKKDW